MPWQQLKFQVIAADAAEVEQVLLEAGAQSVTLLDAQDQPIFQTEPGATPLWDQVLVCALFDLQLALDPVLEQLRVTLPTLTLSALSRETLADQDWKTAWMADFHPMQFGERLWICPSWTPPPRPEHVNVMLDPGLAFGTGTHPTTALCLQWLDQAAVGGKLVIDYGCGSGVLGIAAVLLGASRVLAVDNDPQAVAATATNRDYNRIPASQLQALLPDQLPLQPCDVLLANILAAPLVALAPLFSRLVKPGGSLILSGLIPDQIDELLLVYWPRFAMETPVIRDGWVRLTGTRRQED